ncbi:MAG: bifunctional adenosylcobinamide kinase/adenosylcobinamide-phosphate guanylyltransferase [Propionibacteriaceae bacterium]|jgi:adenosyl cobinamide kinase/adenosyl cobinamide phosphate guanylyltransferase|nr:bifunctional adenosylcobinamide kinase/adenosylcobinamide-phosphate guanylyltransferase [Propionibacteriaceae bacterium]
MMTVVTGPNGSGKSAAAERLARSLQSGSPGGALFYIATLVPADEAGRRRVAAHRRSRSGAGFLTVEAPLGDVEALCPGLVGKEDIVLIEDVSNLVANLAFAARDNQPAQTAVARLRRLRGACRHLVAVTIGGLAFSSAYDDESNAYIAALSEANSVLTAEADRVITLGLARPAGGPAKAAP